MYPKIKFKTTVTNLQKVDDLESNLGSSNSTDQKICSINSSHPKLKLTFKSSEATQSSIFDYVLICTGHFYLAHTPDFPGASTFKGSQLHIHQLREFDSKFESKTVLIIGAWMSTFDMLHYTFSDPKTKVKKLIIAAKKTDAIRNCTSYEPFKSNNL